MILDRGSFLSWLEEEVNWEGCPECTPRVPSIVQIVHIVELAHVPDLCQ